MYALAIANNDMVYLYWYVESKIEGCLGFSVIQHDAKTGKARPLPAKVGFPGDPADGKVTKDTDTWPVQKFSWKDLYAKRGGTYWYEIVPMLGTPGKIEPDPARALRTNTVSLDPDCGDCSVYFNRGIISTLAIAQALPKGKGGTPSADALRKHVAEPGDAFRLRLMGNLDEGVLKLLKRAESEGGHCYCALYELTDEELIDNLKDRKNVHIVLSNADTSEKVDGKTKRVVDGTNTDTREALHKEKMDVTDRILNSGYIGHNKFVVYVDKKGKAQAVLSGSTNWTPSGLCAQSNNAIVVECPDLAEQYLAYWKALQADSDKANQAEDPGALQSKSFRQSNKKQRPAVNLEGGKGNIRVWFSPNTPQKSKPKVPAVPPDLGEVFDLIEGAKQGVLFLAFIPGSPSIVTKIKEVYNAKAGAGERLFVRGAATSPDPAALFKVDLFHRTMKSDARVDSVAGIPQAFGIWEKELYKLGHAVIHDKIVVIDPFTDDCTVVTGSHNLGYKASYSNDENLLIIRGNRAVASAYAAHVLDVYDHYRWRWRLQEAAQSGKKQPPPWQNLDASDAWQNFYVEHKDFLAPEVLFWSPVES